MKVLHAVEWMREMPVCFQYAHGPTAGDDVVASRNKSFERARELVERVAAQLEFKGFHPSVSTPTRIHVMASSRPPASGRPTSL